MSGQHGDSPDRLLGRALVATVGASSTRTSRPPLSGFVTQLIASHRRLPAYRRLVRADPQEASERYGRRPDAVRPQLDRAV